MTDELESMLRRKATHFARLLETTDATRRAQSFEPSTRRAAGERKSYHCPICWVPFGLSGTLELRDLPYTDDVILKCNACNDLTVIPGRELQEDRT